MIKKLWELIVLLYVCFINLEKVKDASLTVSFVITYVDIY